MPKKKGIPGKPKQWIRDKEKRTRFVNKVVNAAMKNRRVKKTDRKPSPPSYKKETLKEYMLRRHKVKNLVSDKKFDAMSEDEKIKTHAVPMREAKDLYLEAKHNWYERFQETGDRVKKKVKYEETVTDPVTKRVHVVKTIYNAKKKPTVVEYDKTIKGKIGEAGTVKVYHRTNTFLRFRDSETGRFVTYAKVKEERHAMRKEAAIYRMAERKKISLTDARVLYESLADESYERYLMKEYAKTPE